MTTVIEYNDAIAVAESELERLKLQSMNYNRSTEGKQYNADLQTAIEKLKIERWNRIKELAKINDEK